MRVRESIYTNPIRPTFGKVTGLNGEGETRPSNESCRVDDKMQWRASQPAPPTAHSSPADYPFSAGRSVLVHGRGAFEKVVGPHASAFGGDGVGCCGMLWANDTVRGEWDGRGGFSWSLVLAPHDSWVRAAGTHQASSTRPCVFLSLDAHLPSWPTKQPV